MFVENSLVKLLRDINDGLQILGRNATVNVALFLLMKCYKDVIILL